MWYVWREGSEALLRAKAPELIGLYERYLESVDEEKVEYQRLVKKPGSTGEWY